MGRGQQDLGSLLHPLLELQLEFQLEFQLELEQALLEQELEQFGLSWLHEVLRHLLIPKVASCLQ